MKNNGILISLIVLALVLIIWSRATNPNMAEARRWSSYGVECLPSGHENLGQHIHPDLFITMDGEASPVPANIGINPVCMAELHTHDATGKIHIETVSPAKEMTLGQFFNVWGESLQKEGYKLTATFGSTTVQYDANPSAVTDHVLKDFEQMHLTYTKR